MKIEHYRRDFTTLYLLLETIVSYTRKVASVKIEKYISLVMHYCLQYNGWAHITKLCHTCVSTMFFFKLYIAVLQKEEVGASVC